MVAGSVSRRRSRARRGRRRARRSPGFAQRSGELAAGGLGGAGAEVLGGGLAQGPHHPGVALGVGLQEVAGGGGRSESGVDGGRGGVAVQGDPQGVGDGPVEGGGDDRVDELQSRVWFFCGGEDAGVAEPAGGVDGLLGAGGRDAGGEVARDGGAEDGAGPGEADGGGAEALQAGDEPAAVLGGGEVAQQRCVPLDGREGLLPYLRGEFDGLEGVSGGEGPDLAAKRVLRVVAEGLADQGGDGFGGERGQVQGRCPARPGRVRKASACAGSSSGR